MVFKGLGGTYDGVLVGDDGAFEVSLALSESLVLFLKMDALDSPVTGLTFLGLTEEVAGCDELLSDLAEEIEDLDDGLVVNLGGQLSKGTDQGLEEGVSTFSEFSLDLLETALNLGESNTGLKVLDDLGCLIDSFNLFDVFSVLLLPCGVLLSTEGLFLSE